MNKRWMVIGSVLVLMALISVGCSLVDPSEPDQSDTPESGSADEAVESGTIIINVLTEPADQAGSFLFTGVPSGTLTTQSSLVVSDLEPGTYSTTQADPAPDFDVVAASCDDGASDTSSSADRQTRTAIVNLDAGETVECTFTNAQRATAVVVAQTDPQGASGAFLFTGIPTGTVPTNGTLVVANLPPGTYTTTEVDPAPQFDLTAVSCDDGGSTTLSQGDPSTRSAIFQLDPGELVTCVFVNTRRGAAVVEPVVLSEMTEGLFTYTGVPSGTVPSGGTLLVADLTPGTYTSTEIDPAPDFELTEVACDDGSGGLASSGDAATRSAIFNIDPGETVRCVFTHEVVTSTVEGGLTPGGGDGTSDDGAAPGEAVNPFDDPETYLADFPLPDELPPDAGSYAAPKAGPWTVTNMAGNMDCGGFSLGVPASPPESGVLEVLDGGQTLVGTGLQEGQASAVQMTADPDVIGRYSGAFEGTEQGVPVTINYVWQVVTDEYIVGFLTSTFTAEGATCTIYRPYELWYSG
jgi:hypothetical protein